MNLSQFTNLKTIICACSGGVDSMVLAHLLQRDLSNTKIHILIVNHNLRENSTNEANEVKQYLKSKNFDVVEILEWKHDFIKTRVEEEGRKARQNLIFDYAINNNIEAVFLGHHLGDVEENFFLKLGMGSGLFGLTSLKMEKDYRYKGNFLKIIRPLVQNTKKEILDFANKNQIFFVQDETNFEDTFKRNRIRKNLSFFEVGNSQFLTTFKALIEAESIIKSRLKKIFDTIVTFDAQFGFFSLKKEDFPSLSADEIKFCLKQMIFYLNEKCQVRTRELENAVLFLQKFHSFTLGGMEIFYHKEKIFFIKEYDKIKNDIENTIWDFRFKIGEKSHTILPKLPFKIIKTLPYVFTSSKKNLAKEYFLSYKIEPVEFKVI